MGVSWPLLLCVLVLTVADGFTLVTRDVTEEEANITCWTCPNKTDNEECNDWAPDRQCPLGHEWCLTTHRFSLDHNALVSSLTVSKECVMADKCNKNTVGCQAIDDKTQLCVSCCNKDYCNEAVPESHDHALMLSAAVYTSSAVLSQVLYTGNVIVGLIYAMAVLW